MRLRLLFPLLAVLGLALPANAGPIPLLGAGTIGAGVVAAPSFVESPSCNQGSGGSCTITWGASPTAGQTLIVSCIGQFGNTVLPPGSPTWTQDYSSVANYGTGSWHRIAGASEPTTATFTNTSGNLGCVAGRFSGAGALQFSENFVNATVTPTTSITPTATNAVPFAIFLGASSPGAFSTPAGYTPEGVSGVGNYGGAGFLGPTIASIAAQNPSSTSGAIADNYAYLYVINHP